MSENGSTWKVTQVAPAQGQVPGQGYQPGWNVTYQLEGGPSGVVFIPKTAADQASVKAAIAADADLLDGISNLTSG